MGIPGACQPFPPTSLSSGPADDQAEVRGDERLHGEGRSLLGVSTLLDSSVVVCFKTGSLPRHLGCSGTHSTEQAGLELTEICLPGLSESWG